jgi:branched-chain amino acid aminotransferase
MSPAVIDAANVWLNGRVIPSSDARVRIDSHGLHYGSGVFEGIRGYGTDRGVGLFRLTDTMRQFHTAARLLEMSLPYTVEELVAATHELVEANEMRDCYIRPIAFYSGGTPAVVPCSGAFEVAIVAWHWENAKDAESGDGIRVKISSWRRIASDAIPYAAKTTGAYLNSVLAAWDAAGSGYDDAVLLTESGLVADCAGANLFAVKDGAVVTPHLSASILPGSTRDAVLALARDLGHAVREAALIRSDLYNADELFKASTASEVVPIGAIDDRELPSPGPLTLSIRELYRDTVAGRNRKRLGWVEYRPAKND